MLIVQVLFYIFGKFILLGRPAEAISERETLAPCFIESIPEKNLLGSFRENKQLSS